MPCWGRKSIVHIISRVFLGPLKEISSKKVMSVSHGLKSYLLEVNSVGCSADRVAQLIWKEWGIWDCHSPKSGAGTAGYQFHTATLFLLGLCCVCLSESWKQFLTCLYWVYPTAEFSFGSFSLHLRIIKNHTLMKYRFLSSGRLVNRALLSSAGGICICWVPVV